MDWQPGYPIDLRGRARARRAKDGPQGDVEFDAGRIVARSTGVKVVLADDNSRNGMPDLLIDYGDGRAGVGEIVTVTDGQRAAEARSWARGELDLHSDLLAWEWWVTAPARVPRARLRERLPRVLEEMEAAGDRPAMHVGIDPDTAGPVALQLLDLGVTEVSANDNAGDNRGWVHWLPEAIGGDPAPDVGFMAWLDRFLTEPVAQSKIAKVTAEPGDIERHLLVGVTWSAPWAVLRLLDPEVPVLPTEAPELPAGLSHLWIWRCESWGRALAWWPERGWFDVTKNWVTS